MVEIGSTTRKLRKKDGRGGSDLSRGSALILTVVLTSLLAIVGVLFLMVSRIDRMATSGMSEDKQLDLAVDTVVGEIAGQLRLDVPGTQIPPNLIFPLGPIFPEGVVAYPDGVMRPEYHDYPGREDRWLAASEPNNFMLWQQISDVTGYLTRSGQPTRNIPIVKIRGDIPIVLDPVTGKPFNQLTDADGDGIGDSKWFMLEGVQSGRGEPVYVAIRITDNGGMINLNAGFHFDQTATDVNSIDGTSLTQINLLALANRPSSPTVLVLPTIGDIDALLLARANYGVNVLPYRLDLYEDNVIWRYGELTMPYTPFDISDELELRNRFLLNQRDIDTRIERVGWAGSFISNNLYVPIGQGGSPSTVGDWFARANRAVDQTVANPLSNRYDYRHIATTYNMERLINPLGSSLNNGKMLNVNSDDRFNVMRAIKEALLDADPTQPPLTVERLACQIAVNIKDFRDEDSDITAVWDASGSGTRYYGYERPCIYISEVVGIYDSTMSTRATYAVELYKPYSEDDTVIGWQLMVDVNGVTVPINWSQPGKFEVVLFKDASGPSVAGSVDPNLTPQSAPAYTSLAGKTIYLQRSAPVGTITVDSYTVPSAGAAGGWLASDRVARSLRRDISRHKCIRRLWDNTASTYSGPTLGNNANAYVDSDARIVQAHPYLDPNVYTDEHTGQVGFKNIGEIGMIFDVNGYNMPAGRTEADLRLDLRGDSNLARIFNYLTVVDPTVDGRDSDGDGRDEIRSGPDPDEIRVPGRININTAPSFVVQQLPWMASAGPAIADMVVAYRDGLLMPGPGAPDFRGRLGMGFRSIGELTQAWVTAAAFPGYYGMDYYAIDGIDQDGFLELTPLSGLGTRDDAPDDFEERDLIFHRISNLVTVRSDVFSAYILVRIGLDGPQRRVLAILDRSEVEPGNSNSKVKVRALHKVADPW